MNKQSIDREILFVVPNDNLGGAENVLKMIGEELVSQQNKVTFYFLSKHRKTNWTSETNISITKYSQFSSQYLGALSLIIFLLQNRKFYTYTFSSHVYVNGLLGFLRKISFLKTKFLVARESTSIFKRYSGVKLLFYRFFYWIGYKNIDVIICQTNQMKNELDRNLSTMEIEEKSIVIPNPFVFPTVKVSEETVKEVSCHQPFIVSAGRLIPEKGFDVLIEVFSKLLDDYPHYKLVILGEGNERESLQNRIKHLNIEKNIILYGHTKEIYPWFSAAEVCVVSSKIEGFPNVLLQMMSQNKKVVSTLCADGIDAIEGIKKAQPNNVDSLYNAILQAMSVKTSSEKMDFRDFLTERNPKNFLAHIEKILMR